MTFLFQGLMHGRGPGYVMDDEDAPPPRAGDIPLVRAVREGRTSYLHPVEVARDPSPLDRWSIIRLDWNFPPFLRPLEGSEFVALKVSPAADGTRIRVEYRYAHQEGVPEAGTRVTLFGKSLCEGSEHVAMSAAVVGGHDFLLPASFAGGVRVEVQPATATKLGPIYGSIPVEIGSSGTCRERAAPPK
jgi:hypothetical protein